VENAVWHGISSLPSDGLIRVIFKKIDDNRIRLTVEDNGVGTKNSQTRPSKEEHLEMGMKLTGKRLRLIGEKYHVQTEIKIESINPGDLFPGTRVEVIVPVISQTTTQSDTSNSR
jgi:LytS/YehU family sensor histidine kinase